VDPNGIPDLKTRLVSSCKKCFNLEKKPAMESNTEIYHIYYDVNINAIVMEWHGYSTSSQFKEGTELMLNTLIKHNASKVLADIKDMVLIGMEDQEWLHSDFLPRAIKSGFKAIALIRPDHYFNKVAVESISYGIDKENITINIFDDLGEAKGWLNTITV